MNKTISINLGGYFFNIEEDAFEMLKIYLDRIKANFVNDPGASEIMADIEVRIAELFQSRLDEKRNVIIAKDVEEIKVIMGQPEDYNIGDDNQSNQSNKSTQEENTEHVRNRNRRVFRDKDDAIMGGVCSGLSHYFGWDPVILRVALALFFFLSAGTALIAYIIFWAVVPAADTTAEKLQMRGEPVNVENISRFVKEEAKNASDNVRNFANGMKTGNYRNQTDSFVYTLGVVLKKLLGVFSILFGLGLLFLLFGIFFFAEFTFVDGNVNYNQFYQLIFGDQSNGWIMTIGIILTLSIPAISAIYGGIKLLTGSDRKIKGLGWIMGILGTIGIILLFFSGARLGSQFKSDATVKSEIDLSSLQGDTLHLDIEQDNLFGGRDSHHDDEFFDLVLLTDSINYFGEPISISFETSEDSLFHARLIKSSNGSKLTQSSQFAANIRYNHSVDSAGLHLGSFMTTPSGDQYRGQHVEVIIYVPRGKYVHFDNDFGLISWHDGWANQTRRWGNEDWLEYENEESEENEDAEITRSVTIDGGRVEIKNEVKAK